MDTRMIRTATLADLDAVAAVEAACFPAAEAATREELADRLAHYGDHFWLMFDGGTLIAFVDGMVTNRTDLTDDLYADAALHDAHGAWQMIFGVNTLPDYRRHGCAGQLIERAIADARAQGRRPRAHVQGSARALLREVRLRERGRVGIHPRRRRLVSDAPDVLKNAAPARKTSAPGQNKTLTLQPL